MICMDELRQIKDDNRIIGSNCTYSQGCFLYIDNGVIEELHTFARLIGLSKKDFKTDNFLPRYVLCEAKRVQAIHKGAVGVLFKKTVEVCRKNKALAASIVQNKRREKEK